MSSTVEAPYRDLGIGGDYKIEMNYGIRIYNGDPLNETIPTIGEEKGTLKGGQRTNFHGEVPILDNNKEIIGIAEVLRIISARPEHMQLEDIQACGFSSIEEAVKYAKENHGEEFARDGVLTVYYYKVKSLSEK